MTNERKLELLSSRTNKQGVVVREELGHCWEWLGAKKEGYGLYSKNTVHRASYELHKGKIPKGLCVRHKCDTRHCWNPDHLELGTIQDNINDKVARGRTKGGSGKKGENGTNVKLSVEDVKEIRENPHDKCHCCLARQFNVGSVQIGRIQHNDRWNEEVEKESDKDDFFRRAVNEKVQRVDGMSECWETERERQIFSFQNKHILGHRVSYTLSKGEIPDKMLVRHKCDNDKCINPEHLELGTHAENMKDRSERGRLCRGEKQHSSKLTDESAKKVFENIGKKTLTETASEFGITKQSVWKIWKKKSWKHIH
jgi:DNA invertase Pin-like site-specific DNA recombinase